MWTLILLLTTLALIYIFIVRPILKTQPAMSAAFKAEASLIDKLRATITGWRTYIAAWLTTIVGIVVGLYDQALPLVTGQDWSPLTAKLPAWSLPVGLVCVGLLFAWLRRLTENPPQLVTQTDETGTAKIVAVIPPAKA